MYVFNVISLKTIVQTGLLFPVALCSRSDHVGLVALFGLTMFGELIKAHFLLELCFAVVDKI